ncbi:MAG: dihydropteroate synthase, partial [Candidatus Nitrosopelagicus sp.]|nr:dihydropteroate synthase [Candidatus Nitrosopelagicus sp.]
MTKLGNLVVGRKNEITIMGILNTSPESFYKNSVKSTKSQISKSLIEMEENGVNIIDIGGMSTAPYLKSIVSEKIESKRVTNAIKIIQNLSNIPISVDTCRASVANDALELGVDVINDISGLKYDANMPKTIQKYTPSVILCSYGKKFVKGNSILETKKFLNESIKIAQNAGISKEKIVVDPAIGFFRRSSDVKNKLPYTKINSDWAERDIEIIKKLNSLKTNFPILVSISNKSFLGKLLGKEDPTDRNTGTAIAEMLSIINGASIIRTHNPKITSDVIKLTKSLTKKSKKG